MTTRAGLIGLLTGLAATLVLFFSSDWPTSPTPRSWAAVIVALLLTIGGALAARWSGSVHPGRCAALGGLSGGLAGTVTFCLFGAAAAGLNSATVQPETVIRQTELAFITWFFGGIACGALGGWWTHPRYNNGSLGFSVKSAAFGGVSVRTHAHTPKCGVLPRGVLTGEAVSKGRFPKSHNNSAEYFDKAAPQMALNVAITAVPASIVASAAAAAVFSVSELPLLVSLLLVLISHLALTLVVPHEARQAEHLCGMDEVKMAAYVAIGAFPAWAVLLLLANAKLFTKPLVIISLLTSASLSLKSLGTLLKMILPMRATFPTPQDDQQKIEAKLFGTIASSRGSRLVVLCIGCGLVMVLPLHVVLISVLITLNTLLIDPAPAHLASAEIAHKLFLSQALISGGLMTASAAILSAIYLFYLNLGRWFSRVNSPSP
jgi:hypothetical protein